MKKFFLTLALACAGFIVNAQIVNPSQPATGVPLAGTGISVSGQTVSVNYALSSQIFAGKLGSSQSTSASTNQGPHFLGTLGFSDTGILGSFQDTANSYLQFVAQNTNAGATASSGFLVANNLTTASTFYGEFGINSSGFTGSGSLNQPSYTYLTSTSGDLAIGTTTANNIHFLTNSASTDAMAISSAGAISMNGALTTAAVSTTGVLSVGSSGAVVTGALTGAGLAPITQNVLNVAALRNFNHLFASTVETRGYYANGDGGGAPYYIKSTTSSGFTDDGCFTIIATDGAVWGLNYQRTVNVKQCGAYGDDTHDDTAAFNAATQASATYSAALTYTIEIPNSPTLYKVNGPVYIRKGQTLRGVGLSSEIDASGATSTVNTFFMGGNSSGNDSGGSPVRVENLWTFGGPSTAAVIATTAAGFTIDNVFMTSPGIGISLNGAGDGLISNVQIDQALSGISISASQNIQFTNFDVYLANYGFTITGASHDIAIGNGVIEYSQYAGMEIQGSNDKSISVTGVNFTMNSQYSTFTGFVNSQANSSDILFSACQFHNMAGPAINQTSGIGSTMTFVGDIFDGAPTTSGYTASTTASVLSTGTSGVGTYDFEGSTFRNLLGGTWNSTTYGAIFTIQTGLAQLKLNGGLISNVPINRFVFNNTDVPKISIKGVTGIGFYSSTSTVQQIVLPYWGASTTWRVDSRGNTNSGGSPNYSATEEAIYTVNYQYSTAGFTFLDKVLLWQSPNHGIPGLLTSAGAFGTAPGGAVSQSGIVLNGTICVSVPTVAATTNFNFYAETMD